MFWIYDCVSDPTAVLSSAILIRSGLNLSTLVLVVDNSNPVVSPVVAITKPTSYPSFYRLAAASQACRGVADADAIKDHRFER